MTVLDTRDLNYTDSFRKVSNIVSENSDRIKELIVIAENQDKSYLMKVFVESLLGCYASMEEQSNTLFITSSGKPEISL